MSKKKKNQEPIKPEKFRLSETEYFWLVRALFNSDDLGLVMTPIVSQQFDECWNKPESYPFRKPDPEDLPAIGALVGLMPV